jgi:phosphatidylserine decarboxylase
MLPFDIIKQYLAPQHGISRFGGLLANNKNTWLKNYLIRYFLGQYPEVNLSEALEPNPYAYTSFNDFFTRKLKPGARIIDPSPNTIISPADGCIQNFGQIRDNQFIQAKNHLYSVDSVLANPTLAKNFKNSPFVTIYLAPKDYHRVHLPFAGKLTDMIYVPGKLFSVNILTTDHVPGLFAKNERVVAMFETAYGPMAVILVGAMIVGSIDTSWAGKVAPGRGCGLTKKIQHTPYSAGAHYKKADEVGFFTLGSTVIVLLPPQAKLNSTLNPLAPIKMGEAIASF